MEPVRSFAPAARIVLALAVAVAVASVRSAPAKSDPSTLTNPKHFFWAGETATADSLSNDIIYHGGSAGPGAIGIEKTPAVYLVYWGPAWLTGFEAVDANGQVFTSKSIQNYLNSFCRNVPAGTTSCAGLPGADFVTNPKRTR